MKLRDTLSFLGVLLVVPGLLLLNGCGGSSGANVITISVSSSIGDVLILGQSTTLTATVSGSTNTMVNWNTGVCTYTIIPTGTTTVSKPVACPTDGSFGTLTNVQATGTASYTAPTKLPDPTKFPSLALIFTATAQADTSKSGTVTIALTSGIAVHLNPVTATVPTNEQKLFFVLLDNDLQTKGVTWLITQTLPTTTTPIPNLPTCSPGCGSITPLASDPTHQVTYTAPSTVPTSTTVTTTPADVTIYAIAASDPSCTTCIAQGTITIITGGPITFNGISPTIAPQGAFYWDIYLDAPNMSSSTQIAIDGVGLDPNATNLAQAKILFPLPTTATPSPSSIGARLRLFAPPLMIPGPHVITISDSGQTVTTPNPPSAYTFNVLPVRPTSTATVPDDVVQGKLAQQAASVVVDGGYFGDGGGLASVSFQGNTIIQDPINPSTAHRLNTLLSTNQINSVGPGLYPLSVARAVLPAPNQKNPAVTNIAVFPDYSVAPPAVVGTLSLPAGSNPGAIDIDTKLGVVVVAETGSNQIQFYRVVPAPTGLTPIDQSGNACAVSCPVMTTANAPLNVPTGLSVNSSDHTVAIVNYGTQTKDQTGKITLTGQSVTVLPIPGAPGVPITPYSLDISGVYQGAFLGSSNAIPMPYSIGVDPDSKLALVAYSSTSSLSSANLGFVVNLNTGNNPPFGCLDPTVTTGPCVHSQVTLNTGAYPHVAVAAHSHLAYVTPGGSGVVLGVDLTKKSTSTPIATASLTAGQVTVTTTTPHGLIPGNAGTVLITGVPNKNNTNVDFNGVFDVTVTSNVTFTYALNSTLSDSETGGTVAYSTPNLQFSISPSLQGIAINPITQTAALANANATGTNGAAQIDLLSALDQSTNSIAFFANCTAYTTPCNSSPELLATTEVAWQPYANILVSYNGAQNQVSISDPVGLQRQAYACNVTPGCNTNPINPAQTQLSGTGTATLTVQNGTTSSLTLFGGLAVDPATNLAFVLQSGSASILIVNLGPSGSNTIKPTQITELVVPGATAGILGGIPNALVPEATLTSNTALSNVKIFGSGFGAPAIVRLDGISITSTNPPGTVNVVSDREIDVTIPASFLSAPHRYSVDLTSTLSNGTFQSNTTDFIVVQSIDVSKVCAGGNVQPSAVAIADQLASGPFSPIAVVTNTGCNSISVIDVNPTITVGGVTMPNPTFGTVQNTVSVGASPQGVAISQRLGLAVVANNGDQTASIMDLTLKTPAPKVPAVTTGTNPTGVAIDDETGAAIVTNFNANTVSMINLGLLFPPAGTAPPTTLTASNVLGVQQPIAVAIDPDRGTNNQGIAVVTALQLNNGAAPTGALAVIDIGLAVPSLSTTLSSGSVTATPTGIVFDPTVATGTQNPGEFYANSSGANVIATFNPDTGGGSGSVPVGINPTSLALNPETGAILTANSASNTISVVDSLSLPFKTHQTLGLPGSPTFGVAIDPFTNLGIIVDQANSRVFLFPMPN